MPDASVSEEKNRLQYFINLTRKKIAAKIKESLETSLSTSLPSISRQELIQYAQDQISYHILQELKQHPNLDKQEYSQAAEESIEKAIDIAEQVRQNFYNLLSPQQEKELAENIQQVLSPEQAQKTAQAAHKLDQIQADNFIDPEQLTDSISKGNIFGTDRLAIRAVIEDVRQAAANNPSKKEIERILDNPQKTLIEDLQNPNLVKLGPNQVCQLCQEIKKNHLSEITEHVQQSVNSLPRQGPFTEGPIITKKTSIQAKHLQVSSIALAHAKAGFSADNPKLPLHLQAEISRIHEITLNPLNPKHQLNLKAHRTALKLSPQIFIAKNFYHPVYQTHQQVLSKANKFLDKPYSFYQTLNEKYDNFSEKYQKFKQETPLGWLVAPRLRLNLAWFNTKQAVKKRTRTIVSKNKFLRHNAQRYRFVKIRAKKFWKKWSPSAVKSRATRWFIRKTALVMIKIGANLAARTATKGIGTALTTIGALTLETATIIGIPLAIIQGSFLIAKGFFNKIKKQSQKQKFRQDTAALGAKALQTILGGLKALGSIIGGSVFSIGGAILGGIIGFSIGGALGVVVGVISGGLLGAGIGAFLGWNWMTIAAIPATVGAILFGPAGILSGGLIGTIPAATANAVALVSTGAIGIPVVQSIGQSSVTSSAFSLPNQSSSTDELSLQKIRQSTPIIKPEFTINYNYQNSTLAVNLQSPHKQAKNQAIKWFEQQGISDLTDLRLEWIEL